MRHHENLNRGSHLAAAARMAVLGTLALATAAGCDSAATREKAQASEQAQKRMEAELQKLTAELTREREARQQLEQEVARAKDARRADASPATTANPPVAKVAAAEPARRLETPRPTGPARGAELHLQQGITFAKMQDWDNSILEFSKAIDIDGRYASAYANRAVAYMQQRKFNKAMDDLKKAESLSPRDKMVFYNYVALYSLQNQLDRALDSLDRALELGFTNYDALRADPDLNNVRRHPEYTKVLEKHKVFIR